MEAEKNVSISKVFQRSMFIMISLSIVIVGAFWIFSDYQQFRAEAALLRREFVDERMNLIRSEVEDAIDYIEFKRATMEKRLKAQVKERVYEAHAIATSIYLTNRSNRSDDQIKGLIRQILRPIEFNRGRGYYFATGLDGTSQINHNAPHFEGNNILDVTDSRGELIVRRNIEIAANDSAGNEGFNYIYFRKPHSPVEKEYPKINFVKLFRPCNWYIGSGEYLDDVAVEVRKEVFERLSEITFDRDHSGYLFVVDYKGKLMVHRQFPALVGKNLWDQRDEDGVMVVQESVRIAREQPAGGFVRYRWKKSATAEKSFPKVGFVKEIRGWNMYVGAAVYMDEINAVIDRRRADLEGQLKKAMLKNLAILLVLFLLAWLAVRKLSARTVAHFRVFTEFFESAATRSEKIAEKELYFSEFKSLGGSANLMIDQRRRVEAALKRSHDELDLRVKERTEALHLSVETLKETRALLARSEKMATLGTLVAGVAHEISTPVGIGVTTASFLKNRTQHLSELFAEKKIRESDFRDYLDAVKSGSGSILTSLNQAGELIRSFKRMAVEQTVERRRKFDLVSHIGDVVSSLSAEYRRAGHDIRVTGDGVVRIDSYPSVFYQIVTNLVMNSIIHGFSGMENKEVTIALSLSEDALRIDYRDNGRGMPPDTAEHIFDPFFTTNREQGGSGLGTHIVHSLVTEKFKGEISCRSAPGEGSLFTMVIPLENGCATV